jgi:hypothetical protein
MARIGSGTISAGNGEYVDVVLTGGRPHRVFVQAHDPGVDFDLRVYDESGNLVQQDVSYSPDAYCIVTPRWTGPFRLFVTAASGIGRYTLVVED